jgi:hypothetical protein
MYPCEVILWEFEGLREHSGKAGLVEFFLEEVGDEYLEF